MTYLLSPKVDFVFKRIFGNENTQTCLLYTSDAADDLQPV